MNWISASVSLVKWLMATTTGRPKRCTFSMCFLRFSTPLSRASTFGLERSFSGTPPCNFRARTVATMTTASGLMPALRHLMFMNFSAPRSAPKPASVTVYSESRIEPASWPARCCSRGRYWRTARRG